MLVLKHCSICATAPVSNRRPPAMAHKLDLAFHRFNMEQTSKEAFARPFVRSSELITTQIASSVVRCLPTDASSGFVDVPDRNPAEPNSPRQIDEELLLAYGGQGSGAAGATQPPPQEMNPSSKSSGKAADTEREQVNAHWYPAMPSGAEAHNAAHCEPTPGNWPEPAPVMKPSDAVGADEVLEAIHAMGGDRDPSAGGPAGGASAGAARDDSSTAAHGLGTPQQQQQEPQRGAQVGRQGESASPHSASQPADDPQEIKKVVREETLGGHE